MAKAGILLNDFRNLRIVGLAENEMLMGPIPRISDLLRLRSERKRQDDPIEQGEKNDARDNPVYREELGYPHSLETHALQDGLPAPGIVGTATRAVKPHLRTC